jgi:hypothetical protein
MQKKEYQDHYESICEVKCTDNGRTMEVDVSHFKPKDLCKILVEGKIEVYLRYNSKHDEYVGSKAGMEFITKGPEYMGSFKY